MMMLINRSNLARTQMNVFVPSSRFKKVLSLLLSQKKAAVAAAWNAPVSIDRSIEHTSFKETRTTRI